MGGSTLGWGYKPPKRGQTPNFCRDVCKRCKHVCKRSLLLEKRVYKRLFVQHLYKIKKNVHKKLHVHKDMKIETS